MLRCGAVQAGQRSGRYERDPGLVEPLCGPGDPLNVRGKVLQLGKEAAGVNHIHVDPDTAELLRRVGEISIAAFFMCGQNAEIVMCHIR